MWVMDRTDPQPREPESETSGQNTPAMNTAEQIAEAAKYFDLYKEGVQILIDLGVPPRQLMGPRDIETTTTRTAVTEPEPTSLQDNVSSKEQPDPASVSAHATDTENPATPKCDDAV
jgi:hypothetical protein